MTIKDSDLVSVHSTAENEFVSNIISEVVKDK